MSTLLRGLKPHAQAPRNVEITAVVTVSDDGGSSGRLRREFDVLPPGDIRNCMVALSEDEGLLSRLFQYRFSEGRGLKGHSFGNLIRHGSDQHYGRLFDRGAAFFRDSGQRRAYLSSYRGERRAGGGVGERQDGHG